MSCHNIGTALDDMTKKVLEMYDAGEISKNAAVKIIKHTKKSVHFCDGNEGETTDCMTYRRCGRCLKTYDKAGEIFAVWGEDEFTEREDVCAEMLCGKCIKEIKPDADLSKYI